VLNIDFSYSLIKNLTDKTAKEYNPKLEYLCMDVRRMDLHNEQFDIVFDKATFDTMMCADTSMRHMKEYLSQIYRVLCEGGTYIMVSYGELSTREKYLREFNWDIKVEKSEKLVFEVQVGKHKKEPPNYYIFICTKIINRVPLTENIPTEGENDILEVKMEESKLPENQNTEEPSKIDEKVDNPKNS